MFPTFNAPSKESADHIAGVLAQRQIESSVKWTGGQYTVYVPEALVNRAVAVVMLGE